MHTNTKRGIWMLKTQGLPAIVWLVVSSTLAVGQTPITLQAFKPSPAAATAAALPPSVQDVPTPTVPSAENPSESNPNRKWVLRALPKASIPESEVASAVAQAPEAQPVIAKVSLRTLPAVQVDEKARYKKEMDGILAMDAEALTNRPFDPTKILNKLQTDRKFFESAAMAEPVRMQGRDIGPYLWNANGYQWQNATFCFSPLYFEQPNLERYGQGVGHPFASTVSAAKFVTDVVTLPAAMVCTPPWRSSCTLGHHRPGDCAPYQRKTLNH